MSDPNSVETLSPQQLLNRLQVKRALNRRGFLTALGASGAVLAGTGVLAGCANHVYGTSTPVGGPRPVQAAGPSESDVLNFALNLEYLEATFYSYVSTGGDIPSASTGGGPAPTGAPGGQPSFQNSEIADLFAEIYFDELSHVNDLRTLLGSAAVPRPQLDLAALGTVSTSNYITFSRFFEDVGVTAYAGAAGDLTAANLQAAAQILAVEAFHSGAIRLIDIQQSVPYLPSADVPADNLDVPPYDPGTVQLAQAGPTTKGGFFATAGANGVASTLPGLAYTRTPSQVLAIVYASSATGTAKGGFFPNGMNGNITTV